MLHIAVLMNEYDVSYNSPEFLLSLPGGTVIY